MKTLAAAALTALFFAPTATADPDLANARPLRRHRHQHLLRAQRPVSYPGRPVHLCR